MMNPPPVPPSAPRVATPAQPNLPYPAPFRKRSGKGAFIGGLCLGIGLTLFLFIYLAFASEHSRELDLSSEISSKLLAGFEQSSSDYIAVIPVHGVIMYGENQNGIVTPDLFSAMMDKAEKDSNVKAVIISIDSPGGEVNAADAIYKRILAFRKKKNVPVIALMRTIAASGGYYVAAGCDKIIAGEMTLTGSIGVIISSYNVTGLLDMIGVKGEVYKSGALKDMLSPTKVRTPEEQAVIQELVKDSYLKFAGIVAKSRNIPLKKITEGPIGDGRVYHGKKALEYGVIDKLGDMETAVELCKEMSGAGQDLSVKQYVRELTFSDIFFSSESIFRNGGTDVKVSLPGSTPSVELQPGRLYFLPAGL